ncbi:MAG: virulence factor [Caldilineaceae bacterium]|nr:virulence factor [Caldilineaceae bacterium]
MTQVQITYWQEFPALVTAQEGRRNRARVELAPRFQAAIDEAAMRLGLSGTDAYLEQWRRSDWTDADGTPEDVARQVAAQLEADYPPSRIRAMLAAIEP